MSKSKVQHFVSEQTGETYSLFGYPISDEERERRGQMTLIDCSGDVDRTRQEDAVGRSPKDLWERFGASFGADVRKSGVFQQDLDLQAAYEARGKMAAAYAELPKFVRDRYPDLEAVVAASERGELEALYKAQEPKKPDDQPAAGSAPVGSEPKP